MKNKIEPLPKNVEAYINASLIFNKFGIVNLSVLRATTKTELTDSELKKRIKNRFASEMVNGKIEFLIKEQKYYLTVSYQNIDGGLNNLQVAKLSPVGAAYSHIKCFTSKSNKAESYAKRFANKNKLKLV